MKHNRSVDMRNLFTQWQTSGLSKQAFAMNNGISKATFYYWVKKFEASKSDIAGLKSFLPVHLSVPVSTTATAIVRYPSGVSIEWHGTLESIHLLKTLV